MIQINELAKKKLFELSKQHNKNLFYFALNGGGCSGFTYIFGFDEGYESDPEDFLLELKDQENFVRIRIDFFSLPMLSGTTIEWEESGFSSRFKFNNPNATAGCGCGKSVSL